jgi:hypothetical protein
MRMLVSRSLSATRLVPFAELDQRAPAFAPPWQAA